jgi:hypothetical protein
VEFVAKFSGNGGTGALAAAFAGGGEMTLLTGIVEVTDGELVSTATTGGIKAGEVHEIGLAPRVAFSNRIGGGPTSGR